MTHATQLRAAGYRTDVRYPGHPEWTEVFDLAADPYELKNLAADPAAAAKLSAEFDTQVKAVKYAVPADADFEVAHSHGPHRPRAGGSRFGY